MALRHDDPGTCCSIPTRYRNVETSMCPVPGRAAALGSEAQQRRMRRACDRSPRPSRSVDQQRRVGCAPADAISNRVRDPRRWDGVSRGLGRVGRLPGGRQHDRKLSAAAALPACAALATDARQCPPGNPSAAPEMNVDA